MINQKWVFGNNAGLDFSTNPPTPISGFSMNTREGCASICNSSGVLLFYTDGGTVWDAIGTPKVFGLKGDSSSTQSAIIVPDPSNSIQYYILTMDGSSNPVPPFNHFDGILLNIVTWQVTQVSSLLTLPPTSGFSPAEKIVAIPHSNCKDFWVITLLQKGSDGATTGSGINRGAGYFRIFKITASGITYVNTVPLNQDIHEVGYLKGSHDGKKLAIANGQINVLIYPFDNSTGIVNIVGVSTIQIPTVNPNMVSYVYGLEFSPNNNLLYYGNLATASQPGYIFQVDLTASTLSSLNVGTILNSPNAYAIGALQLGMDNRIYIAKDKEKELAVILYPDIPGTGCLVQDNYILLLSGSECQLGLPNLIPNVCKHDCGCGCTGCNDKADEQNKELIVRAKAKYNTIKSKNTCGAPFGENCEMSAINGQVNLEPCFYFQWGDGVGDQIEEHDTEVFYITVCNPFKDIQYNGFKITKLTLVPNIHPLNKIQIVPDRFICLDCLPPCSCQTREFAMITRADNTAGTYSLEVEYCYENITFAKTSNKGKAQFKLEITED